MQQNEPIQRPTPPPAKYRFRWELYIGIPLAVLFSLWLFRNARIHFDLERLMWMLHIHDEEKFVRLLTLMILCLVFILVMKVLKQNH